MLNAGGTGIVQGFRSTGTASSRSQARREPRPRQHRPAELPDVARPGRLHAGRKATDRHDEGERKQIEVFQVGARRNAVRHRRCTTRRRRRCRSRSRSRTTAARDGRGRRELRHDVRRRARRHALRAAGRRPTARPRSAGSTRVGRFYYVSNTGSNNISGYRIDADGQPSLIGPTGIVATTELGPIDSLARRATASSTSRRGLGTVDEYRVNDDGTLTDSARSSDCRRGSRGSQPRRDAAHGGSPIVAGFPRFHAGRRAVQSRAWQRDAHVGL